MHESTQARLQSSQNRMIVTPHKHQHKALDIKEHQAFTEDIEESFIIATVSEYGIFLVSSRQHRIERVLVFNTQLSGHFDLPFIIKSVCISLI